MAWLLKHCPIMGFLTPLMIQQWERLSTNVLTLQRQESKKIKFKKQTHIQLDVGGNKYLKCYKITLHNQQKNKQKQRSIHCWKQETEIEFSTSVLQSQPSSLNCMDVCMYGEGVLSEYTAKVQLCLLVLLLAPVFIVIDKPTTTFPMHIP